VLDSEAPKLPIHTAIAVPQYGTQGSVGHLAALPIWRLSPLRTWIPATLERPQTAARNTALRNVRELRSCAGQPARRCLHCAVASKTARSNGNRSALCRGLGRPPRPAPPRTPRRSSGGRRRWDADSRSHQPDSPEPSRSWSLPCESPVQRIRGPGEWLQTAADLDVRCPLMSFAIPQGPPSCGPSTAHPGSERPRRTRVRQGDHSLARPTPCSQSQFGHCCHLRGRGTAQAEAASWLSVVVRSGPFRTAVNGTLVARPARMTLAHRGAIGSASTGG
jgi:hypothetical protein